MPSTVTFSGLPSEAIFAGYGTHCRGPQPSCFFLVVKPNTNVVCASGDLVFTDTDSSKTLTFKDCIVDKVWLREHYGQDPQCMWHVRILDRRVQWANQFYTYEANVRCPDGTIQPWSEKTAAQIATDLLDLMGEAGYDVTDVPGDVYPYVAFSGPPAFALDEMVRRLGGWLILKNDDSVAIQWPGNGTDVANSDGAFTTYHNIALEKPANVKVTCGDTWWESLFDLVAVGEEAITGAVKTLATLSYCPGTGFGWPQFFADVSEEYRSLAFKSVYRWYRVVDLSQGGFTPTSASEAGTTIDQMLPLRGVMCKMGDNHANQNRPMECAAYGIWWPWSDHPYNTAACQLYPGGFDLEEENGIVKFHEHVIMMDGDCGSSEGSGGAYLCMSGGSWCPVAADMKLWAAHRFRMADGTFDRKEFTYAVADGTGPDLYVYVPELFLVYKQTYAACSSPSTTSNLTSITTEADAIGALLVAAIEDRFDVKRLEYPLLQPTDLDGDIAQVQYHCNQYAHETIPTRTIVSIGAEGDYYEQEDAAKAKAAQTAMAVMERMKGDTPRRRSPHVKR